MNAKGWKRSLGNGLHEKTISRSSRADRVRGIGVLRVVICFLQYPMSVAFAGLKDSFHILLMQRTWIETMLLHAGRYL